MLRRYFRRHYASQRHFAAYKGYDAFLRCAYAMPLRRYAVMKGAASCCLIQYIIIMAVTFRRYAMLRAFTPCRFRCCCHAVTLRYTRCHVR